MKKIISVLLLVLLVLFVFTGCDSAEREQATVNFNSLVGEIQMVQSELDEKNSEAEDLANSIQSSDVSDDITITDLKKAVEDIKALSVSLPEIASETNEIKEQIIELESKKIEIQRCLDDLQQAIDNLNSSKTEYENIITEFNTLTSKLKSLPTDIQDKISSAEDLLYSTKKDDVSDTSVLTKLQAAIDEAKKNKPADIPEMGDTYSEIKAQVNELTSAKNTLQGYYDEIDRCSTNVNTNIAVKRQAKLDAAVSLNKTHTATHEDSNGFKIKATIRTTSWLKGSDYDTLNKAWKNAGGITDFPNITEIKGGVNHKFDMNSAVFAIGTCEFSNVTGNGFDISDANKHNPSITITPGVMHEFFDIMGNSEGIKFVNDSYYYPKSFKMKTLFSGVYYESSGWNYNSGYSSVSAIGLAKMTSNHWGPVTFFIAYDDIFTPANPDGVPELDDMMFRFYVFDSTVSSTFKTDEFKFEKSW